MGNWDGVAERQMLDYIGDEIAQPLDADNNQIDNNDAAVEPDDVLEEVRNVWNVNNELANDPNFQARFMNQLQAELEFAANAIDVPQLDDAILPLAKQHNSAVQAQQPRKKRAVLEDLSNVSSKSSEAKDAKDTKIIKITNSAPLESANPEPGSNKDCVDEKKAVPALPLDRDEQITEKTKDTASVESQEKEEQKEPVREEHPDGEVDAKKVLKEDENKESAIASSKSASKPKEEARSTLVEVENGETNSATVSVEPKSVVPSDSKADAPPAPVTDEESTSHTSLKRTASDADTEAASPEAEGPVKRARTYNEWDDLDAEEADDPLMVVEYAEDIFGYLYEIEDRYIPNPDYMSDQRELDWPQRALLIDWIIEVHQKLHLLPETLFLAVNIIDRFMTLRVVGLDKIQLVGVTALLIAAKYEEVFPPVLSHFVYLTAGSFSDEDLIGAEKFMLQVLEYEMSFPNPLNFLRRISKADEYHVQSRAIAKYLLELCMLDHELLGYPPSLHAAAAMYLSRCVLGLQPFRPSAEFERQQQQEQELEEGELQSDSRNGDAGSTAQRPPLLHWDAGWNRNLVHYCGGFTYLDILPLVRRLIRFLSSGGGFDGEAGKPSNALFRKYSSRKYYKAALIVDAWLERQRSAVAHNASLNSAVAAGNTTTNTNSSSRQA
ncbi:hypothetical protein D0Z00_000352 [Geotrichum galactomycetum]|uniref:Uncharacterized protein n=1 Tax=Geotrichum galactomycetum TaxID=27317 RepID=A0ACB6V9W5_9ASCO|nr:hypothetical protein D0Z00_000352 [Geotrichum candidum]